MLIRQASLYLVGWAGAAGVNLVALAVYTHLMTPGEYGLYAIAVTIVQVVFSVTILWLCSGALRLVQASGDREALKSVLVASLAGMLAAIAVPVAVAWSLLPDEAERQVLLLGYGLLAATGWIELNLHILRADLRAASWAAVTILRALAAAVGGGIMAAAGFGGAGALAGVALGTALPGFWLAARDWRGLGRHRSSPGMLRQLVGFGAPLTVSYAFESVLWYSSRLLLGWFGTLSGVGIYAAGYDMADRTLKGLMAAAGNAGLSLAINEAERNPTRLDVQLRRNLTLLFAIGLPAAIGMALLAPELSGLIGPDYRDGARQVIPIIAIATFASCLRGNYFDHAFYLSRHTRLFAWLMVATSATNVALCCALIPAMGVLGAALATLGAFALSLVLGILLGRRVFAMPLPFAELGRIALAAATMAAALVACPSETAPLALAWKVPFGAAIYAAVATALDVMGSRRLILQRLGARLGRPVRP